MVAEAMAGDSAAPAGGDEEALDETTQKMADINADLISENLDKFEQYTDSTLPEDQRPEIWLAADEHPEVREWQRHHDSLETYPGRKEAISVTLEHRDLGTTARMWMAEILRPEGESPKLADWQDHGMNAKVQGRFAGYYAPTPAQNPDLN
jgi:hypothetical protein